MRKAQILCLLLLAGSLLLFAGCGGKETASSSNATKQVVRGDLIVGLTADGTVALPVTNLNFEVAGTVRAVHAAPGQAVKKGDLLMELEDADVQLEIETARNQLEKARANYADAVWSYTQSLKSDELKIAQAKANLGEFDPFDYETAVADAKRILAKRKAELAEAEKNVRFPYDATSDNRKLRDARALSNIRAKEFADASAALLNYFDDTEYKRKIADAEALAAEKEKALRTAIGEIDKAVKLKDLEFAETQLKRIMEDMESAKKKAYADAAAKYNTAQKNHSDAQTALSRLEQDVANNKKNAGKNADEQLAEAKSKLTDAKNALTKAEKNLDKAKKDFASSMKKSEGDFELMLEAYEWAQQVSISVSNAASAVKDAELGLEEAENKFQKVQIISPIDGAVLSVTKKEGEKVTANNNAGNLVFGTSGSGSSVVTVCDLSEVYLTANITEGDIVGVEPGQEVRVQIDSIGDENFPGKVMSVSSLPNTDASGITTYSVTVKLDNARSSIKDGMTALITFVRLEHEDVLMIPNRSVFIEDGKQFVHVEKSNGGYEKREVRCGLTNGTETEVLDGLKEGETVVVGSLRS